MKFLDNIIYLNLNLCCSLRFSLTTNLIKLFLKKYFIILTYYVQGTTRNFFPPTNDANHVNIVIFIASVSFTIYQTGIYVRLRHYINEASHLELCLT